MISNEFNALLQSRRTIHDFLPEAVDAELVMQALAMACWVPNHHLTEPWQFYHLGLLSKTRVLEVVYAHFKQNLRKGGALTADKKIARWQKIPGWIVATQRRCEDVRQAKEDYAACSCAIYNVMLALHAADIGSKWSTGDVIFTPDFYNALGIDQNIEEIIGLLWYGKAQKSPHPTRATAYIRQLA